MKKSAVYIVCGLIVVVMLSIDRVKSAEPDDTGWESAFCDADTFNRYTIHFDSMPDGGRKLRTFFRGSYGREFGDKNDVHLEAATAIGIEPITDLASVWNLRRPIVKIESCREYYLDSLTHSYPYLVPEAATLLKEIGQRFNDSLASRGGGYYRIKVTSVLRTPAMIARLRRRNPNATKSSAHQYGTTFDIGYSKFICDSVNIPRTQADLKALLGEVLQDLREEGRCYVKHERRQGCFHITTRK